MATQGNRRRPGAGTSSGSGTIALSLEGGRPWRFDLAHEQQRLATASAYLRRALRLGRWHGGRTDEQRLTRKKRDLLALCFRGRMTEPVLPHPTHSLWQDMTQISGHEFDTTDVLANGALHRGSELLAVSRDPWRGSGRTPSSGCTRACPQRSVWRWPRSGLVQQDGDGKR